MAETRITISVSTKKNCILNTYVGSEMVNEKIHSSRYDFDGGTC
jgi:hypothetical protein